MAPDVWPGFPRRGSLPIAHRATKMGWQQEQPLTIIRSLRLCHCVVNGSETKYTRCYIVSFESSTLKPPLVPSDRP